MVYSLLALGPEFESSVEQFIAEQIVQNDWARRPMGAITRILAYLTEAGAKKAYESFRSRGFHCVLVNTDDVRFLCDDVSKIEVGEENSKSRDKVDEKLLALERKVLAERIKETLFRMENADHGAVACQLMNHYEYLKNLDDDDKESVRLREMSWNLSELFQDDDVVEAVHPSGHIIVWTEYYGWKADEALDYFLRTHRVEDFEDLDDAEQEEYLEIEAALSA